MLHSHIIINYISSKKNVTFNFKIFNIPLFTTLSSNNDIRGWECSISTERFDKINIDIRYATAMKYRCYNRLSINNGQSIGDHKTKISIILINRASYRVTLSCL